MIKDTATNPKPTVEEAQRVIEHILSFEDNCDATLDAVRSIMQWLSFDRPTEAALHRHLTTLRKPVPEGIREGVDHVPTTRHRTSIILNGILRGYLEWLKANSLPTYDDPYGEPTLGSLCKAHILINQCLEGRAPYSLSVKRRLNYLFRQACKAVPSTDLDRVSTATVNEPHRSHHILVHDNLGTGDQTEVCGYCGKSDAPGLKEPCRVAERMNREETEAKFARLEAFESALKDFPSLARNLGSEKDTVNRVESWYRKHIWPMT